MMTQAPPQQHYRPAMAPRASVTAPPSRTNMAHHRNAPIQQRFHESNAHSRSTHSDGRYQSNPSFYPSSPPRRTTGASPHAYAVSRPPSRPSPPVQNRNSRSSSGSSEAPSYARTLKANLAPAQRVRR